MREPKIAADGTVSSLVTKGVLVNEKTNLRYDGFRPGSHGGRIFEFSVSAMTQVTIFISIEIPEAFFVGSNRIQLQEGVGVSYAKLKHLLTIEPAGDIPQFVCLTATDLAQFRQLPMESKRRWGHRDKKAATNIDTQSTT